GSGCCTFECFVNFVSGFFQQNCSFDLEPALIQDLLTLPGIRTLQTYDQGNMDIHFFCRFHNSPGNPVTPNDTSKDIDEDGLDFRFFQDDSKARLNRFSTRSSSNV